MTLLKVLVAILALFAMRFGAVVASGRPALGTPGSPITAPTSVLESDRAQIQLMSTVAGAQMPMDNDPMWQRAADPAYIAQLHAYINETNRMLGVASQP